MTRDHLDESDVVIQTEHGERYESLGYSKSGGAVALPTSVVRGAQILRKYLL